MSKAASKMAEDSIYSAEKLRQSLALDLVDALQTKPNNDESSHDELFDVSNSQ